MASRTISGASFSRDTIEFLRLLARYRVRYVIVGGEAVIFHGYPRVTGDVDFFYENTPANVERLFGALSEFWSGRIPAVSSPRELRRRGLILQFGRPPNRIDLLNEIDGVRFAEAWRSRVLVRLDTPAGTVIARYIHRRPLLTNKRASGRPKDLDDARYLTRSKTRALRR